MTAAYFPIVFDYEGIHYAGRVTPEKKHEDAAASSYHVVLNEVFFGYLHYHDGHWHVSEQRPAGLVQATGKQIEKLYPAVHST
jgi:hypothetical protein